MTTPYKVIEEYVFYKEGLSPVIHGRVTVSVGSPHEEWTWETNYVDGSHRMTHVHSVEQARAALFNYVNNFNVERCVAAEYY
ncbi:hypothetical protein ACIQCX_15680 [Enterobacter cancerogenus]|uniref:hypothetical protein n=1 Tax=Enterobacter cancerogenus TaxID=69218 RepID=UPI0038272A24